MEHNTYFPAVVLNGDDYLILLDLGKGFKLAVKTGDAMGGSTEAPVVIINTQEIIE